MNKILHLTVGVLLSAFYAEAQNAGSQNIDFNTGTFDGWEMQEGRFEWSEDDGKFDYTWTDEITEPSSRFDILNDMSPTDPIAACATDIFPEGTHNFIIRIGRPNLTTKYEGAEGFHGSYYSQREKWAGAEKAQYSFVVTEETKALVIGYSSVIHDPNGALNAGEHYGDMCPAFSFSVEAKDAKGNTGIFPCGSFTASNANSESLVRLPRAKDCPVSTAVNNKPEEYLYSPWKTVVYDLQDKVGQTVTFTALNHDCHVEIDTTKDGAKYGTPYLATSHESYGYISPMVSDLKLDVAYFDTLSPTVTAPYGFSTYKWTLNGEQSKAITILDGGRSISLNKYMLRKGDVVECILGGSDGCGSVSAKAEIDITKIKFAGNSGEGNNLYIMMKNGNALSLPIARLDSITLNADSTIYVLPIIELIDKVDSMQREIDALKKEIQKGEGKQETQP